ncbi:hypothetical protein FHP25_33745 [Vineibacter terrae]|uniref:Uncharacterized protein n=1 Tax=Vineibacter terrae TaxID=2586908 RepID=A0A5C8PAP2_9HYPH|nr:hypothetical protein [Vineibacter terrae]TXL70618.1 hypothetical protein FHP25_33745 [Vineibacter terrae]
MALPITQITHDAVVAATGEAEVYEAAVDIPDHVAHDAERLAALKRAADALASGRYLVLRPFDRLVFAFPSLFHAGLFRRHLQSVAPDASHDGWRQP